MHARQSIRDQVVATLTGLTTTGARVYTSRVYNTRQEDLPCLLVYTLEDEVSESVTIGYPRIVDRDMLLAVEVRVQAVADFDDLVDTICEEVETALAADVTVGGNARDLMHNSTQISFTADGSRPFGSALMSFNIRYRIRETAPGQPIA